MPDLEPHPPVPSTLESGGPDPLASLKKMSRTAGAGSQEYSEVNTVAVVAAMFGLASVLVVLSDVLFVIPVTALVCGIVAIRQIRNSNGTQTGNGIAAAGIALAVLLGGGVLASRAMAAWNTRNDRLQIAGLIETLGRHIAAQSYHDGYLLFSDRFKSRVSEDHFTDVFKALGSNPEVGALKSMTWNGRIEFEDDEATGGRIAAAVALSTFAHSTDPPRQTLMFAKHGDKWVIDDFPLLFPAEKKKKQ